MRRVTTGFMIAMLAMLMIMGTPAGAVTNGDETDSGYSYVGALVADYEGYGTGIGCSGTLIAPNVFLTAAHCVVGVEEFGVQLLGVTFEPTFLDLTDPTTVELYEIADIVVNPDYPTDGSWDPYTDVAVIILADPVAGIEPAQLPTLGQLDPLATQRGRQDTSLTIVGYGTSEMSQAGGQLHPVAEYGIRRSATTQLININHGVPGETMIQYTANGGGDKGGTCYGDSGGALFLNDSTTIVGVTSGINNKVCNGGWGFNYRLDTPEAYDFLDDFVTLPDAEIVTEEALLEPITEDGLQGEAQAQGDPATTSASTTTVGDVASVDPAAQSQGNLPAEQAAPVAEEAVTGEHQVEPTVQAQVPDVPAVDDAIAADPAPGGNVAQPDPVPVVEDIVAPAPVQDQGEVVEPGPPVVSEDVPQPPADHPVPPPVPVEDEAPGAGQGLVRAPGQSGEQGKDHAPGQTKESGTP